MQERLEQVEQYLNSIDKYKNKLTKETDENTLEMLKDSIILKYYRLYECIKYILNEIAIKENIKYNNIEDLLELTSKQLNIRVEIYNVIKQLIIGDKLIHDYINSEYYNELIVAHITKENTIEVYKEYLRIIKERLYILKIFL